MNELLDGRTIASTLFVNFGVQPFGLFIVNSGKQKKNYCIVFTCLKQQVTDKSLKGVTAPDGLEDASPQINVSEVGKPSKRKKTLRSQLCTLFSAP